MRPILLFSSLLLAVSCTQTTGPATLDQREAEEGVCAMTVADHIDAPVDDLTATWESPTPDGGAIVAVRAADSLHTCTVSSDLQVRALAHPRGPGA